MRIFVAHYTFYAFSSLNICSHNSGHNQQHSRSEDAARAAILLCAVALVLFHVVHLGGAGAEVDGGRFLGDDGIVTPGCKVGSRERLCKSQYVSLWQLEQK
jgi:hypothetical protein